MLLSDLESIDKQINKKNKKNLDEKLYSFLVSCKESINQNKDLRLLSSSFDTKYIKQSGLLSIKPKIYVCNVDEKSIKEGNNYTTKVMEKFGIKNTLLISAETEDQINKLDTKEKENYMKIIGIKNTGLKSLIEKGYKILDLETFFTSGPEESRAWTIKKNSTAPEAAEEIHSDFRKGFIRAETVSYVDFVENSGWNESKNKGKMRLEGKDYIVQDGDVLNFRFNT